MLIVAVLAALLLLGLFVGTSVTRFGDFYHLGNFLSNIFCKNEVILESLALSFGQNFVIK